LFNLIPYRGRGLFKYIKTHIVTNRNRNKYEAEFKNMFGE
jgi:hypothetical protein